MDIYIKDDFDLRKIVNSGQCFRPKETEPGTFRFITEDKVLYVTDKTSSEKGLFSFSCSKEDYEYTWIHYFDLNRNYSKIRKNIPKEDLFLTDAAKLGKGIRILNQDPFEMLISFIISQRKSIPAIRSSVEKICLIYGKEINTGKETLHLFPSSKEIVNKGTSALAECSLGYRLPYIEEVVESIAAGVLNLGSFRTLSDDELLSELMKIKGVGIKVASCVALFAYGRGAIAPVDTWINRVIDEAYGGVNPFPGFGSNSGIYQQYAFYKMIR